MKRLRVSPVLALLFLFGTGELAMSHTDKVDPVKTEGRTFSIEPSYNLADAIVGKSFALKVKITGEAIPSAFLEIEGLPVVSEQDGTNLIHFNAQGRSDEKNGMLLSKEYLYDVQVSGNAEPRRYKIRLDLRYPSQEIISRVFYLNIGVESKGKLEVIKEDEESQPPSFETGVFSGQKYTYELNLRNSFPDYTVYIEKIKVQSDPAGLIQTKEIAFDNPIPLRPAEEKTIPLEIEVATLGLRNLLKGLATTPRLKADVLYNDGNERRISDFKPREKINISPRGKVVLGAVLLGLLIGAIIRSVLEFMLFKKQITRKGIIKVVSYSLVFGMLLVILAVAGKIEVKAFAVSGSYDNPLAMLVIGMIGALAGLQIIIGWYKGLKAD
jgi:hypothetical protein